MRLPYRHHLHGTSDPETVKLLSRLLVPRSVGDSPSDLAEVIDTASELVLWHLARELRNTDPQAPYAAAITALGQLGPLPETRVPVRR